MLRIAMQAGKFWGLQFPDICRDSIPPPNLRVLKTKLIQVLELKNN